MSKGIKQIILDNNSIQNLADLSNEGKVLFDFLTLIVDIKYRNQYGTAVAKPEITNYSVDTQSNNVPTDQLSPADSGLLRH